MFRPLVLLFCLLGSAAHADKVALVIGNSAYQNTASLPNAATDAADMAARLAGLGFKVHGGIDLDRQATLAAVESFADALSPEDLALFYYAGHGAQIGTENYIIPIDVLASDEVTLAKASIRFQTILRTMELRADRRIVILDACRNNPFLQAAANRSGVEPARGLAKVEGGVGTYIAFSTQPGNVALDGEGRNSPFTTALLAHIGDPGADIHAMMRKVRGDVVAATGETQIPWENSSLVDEVYLAADGVASVASPTPKASPPVSEPAASGQLHYVGGLDPNGDGFLALRDGTSPDARRLAKMTEGTPLEVLDTDGPWFRVRLLDGCEGWAHSNWIRCCIDGQSVQPRAEAGASCDDLWYRRNAIWAGFGYCFTSPRGQATFGNDACFRTQEEARSAMSASDLALVDQLKAMETAEGFQ